jgi:hypothetical protein
MIKLKSHGLHLPAFYVFSFHLQGDHCLLGEMGKNLPGIKNRSGPKEWGDKDERIGAGVG